MPISTSITCLLILAVSSPTSSAYSLSLNIVYPRRLRIRPHYAVEQPTQEFAEREGGGSTMPSMPTNREILMFSGPALGLWITGPLLSLIDSSAVGVTGSATQLAALGPATTMIDGASYLFAFINGQFDDITRIAFHGSGSKLRSCPLNLNTQPYSYESTILL